MTVFLSLSARTQAERRSVLSATALWRITLVLGTLASLAAATVLSGGDPVAVDPDLARVLRGMALIKAAFAMAAFALAYWRLRLPRPLWRMTLYVAGTMMMAGGALALWHLRFVEAAGLVLHVGLFGVVALALTDSTALAAIPARRALR